MSTKFDPRTLWTNYFSSINAAIRAGLGLAVVAVLVLSYVYENKFTDLQRLELLTYDIRLRATAPRKVDPRIVIIDVDEKTLAAEGRWPLARDRWVALLDNAFGKYKLKVMGFDVIFSEPDTSSGLQKLQELATREFKDDVAFRTKLTELTPTLDFDARFAATLKKYPVVLAFAGNSERAGLESLQLGVLPAHTFTKDTFGRPPMSMAIDGYSSNLPAIQASASAAGHILPAIDFDGVLRRAPMFVNYKDNFYESLSLATYRTYLDNEALRINPREDEGDGIKRLKNVQIGSRTTVELNERGFALIPFRGPWPMFRYISATDIIRDKLQPGELEGKIALVGTSAQGLFDLRATPFGEAYPGVEAHANLISGFLDNNIKRVPSFETASRALMLILIGVPLALALVKLSPLWSTVTVVAMSGIVIGINMYFWSNNVVLPLALPLILIGALFLLNMAYGFFVEARSKRAITGIFGTYVPKELVEEMAKDPEAYSMKGESRDMTVLFSDVRNFTTISEGLSPTELTAMMNAYLTAMTQCIQEDKGTIDKYIGDAIMAFWGAPLRDEKHATNALLSAIRMQKKVKEIAPDFIKRGWPALEIGVGLNCGNMNVGDMGSSFRRSYTVMGDAVNLASRLEGLTKEYGVGILVSENIVRYADVAVYRELDRVRVKGKLEPICIYEPVGLQGEVNNETVNNIDRFHKALDRFRAQRWDDAERIIKELLDADPSRKVYKVYLERIAILRMKPPGANWDGVFTFTTK